MEGKVIAVTGGASGIGLATAKLLAARGAKVSIADNCQQESLDEATVSITEWTIPTDHIFVSRCDVRDAAQVRKWLIATVSKFGRLDHVASVAGVMRLSTIAEQDEESWDFVIGVNLTGTMHVLRESVNLMSDNAGCSIVVVASTAGQMGVPTAGAYCASKHGVIGLARTLAKEVGPRGIRVNCVAPGAIDTPMHDTHKGGYGAEAIREVANALPIARVADAIEVAKVIAFLLGNESSYVTGSVYTIDGGYTC